MLDFLSVVAMVALLVAQTAVQLDTGSAFLKVLRLVPPRVLHLAFL